MIFENEELSDDVYETPDEAMNVSVPISMILHSSGEISVVVIDLKQEDELQCFAERTIRFSAHAAAQFLDAMGSTVQSGHLLFGDERPERATLH